MEKTYFIRKMVGQPKNKIDQMLHESFEKYNFHLISEDDLEVFNHEFEFIVNKYQMAGGRAAVPHYYKHKPGFGGSILITMSESIAYILYPIKGTIAV